MISRIDIHPRAGFLAQVRTHGESAWLKLRMSEFGAEVTIYGRPDEANALEAVADILNEIYGAKVEAPALLEAAE